MELGGKNVIKCPLCTSKFQSVLLRAPSDWIIPHSGTSAFDLNIMLESMVALDVVVYHRTLVRSQNTWQWDPAQSRLYKSGSSSALNAQAQRIHPDQDSALQEQHCRHQEQKDHSNMELCPIHSLPSRKSSLLHWASHWSFNFLSWPATCLWQTEMVA